MGYVRVSSTDQNPARQVEAVGAVEETFTDHVSGGSRAERSMLAAMLRYVRRGGTVRVASMDRLARSVVDLAGIVTELTGRGVAVQFVAERLSFDLGGEDPFAVFQLHLLGAVAQLERSLVRERQREGIALVKERRVYRGRARRLDEAAAAEARRLAGAGVPEAKIARDLVLAPGGLRRAERRRGVGVAGRRDVAAGFWLSPGLARG